MRYTNRKASLDLRKTNDFLLSSAFFDASDYYYNVDTNAHRLSETEELESLLR